MIKLHPQPSGWVETNAGYVIVCYEWKVTKSPS